LVAAEEVAMAKAMEIVLDLAMEDLVEAEVAAVTIPQPLEGSQPLDRDLKEEMLAHLTATVAAAAVALDKLGVIKEQVLEHVEETVETVWHLLYLVHRLLMQVVVEGHNTRQILAVLIQEL
jgi:hypothetical protein